MTRQRKTARQRVFEAFLTAPRHTLTTAQLCQPDVGGVRFSARIFELEHEYGCHFTRTPLRAGSWSYTLLSWPAEVSADPVPGADPGGHPPVPPDGRDTDGALAGVLPPDSGEAPSLFGADVGRSLPAHDREAV